MFRLVSHYRMSRFALIGITSTLIYAICAFLLSQGQETAILPAALGSFTAYAVAALFSYTGHKYFTFVSGGEHLFEAPRFLALTVAGLAFSSLLSALLAGFGIPPLVPIVITCIVVPMVNFFALGKWVFSRSVVTANGLP